MILHELFGTKSSGHLSPTGTGTFAETGQPFARPVNLFNHCETIFVSDHTPKKPFTVLYALFTALIALVIFSTKYVQILSERRSNASPIALTIIQKFWNASFALSIGDNNISSVLSRSSRIVCQNVFDCASASCIFHIISDSHFLYSSSEIKPSLYFSERSAIDLWCHSIFSSVETITSSNASNQTNKSPISATKPIGQDKTPTAVQIAGARTEKANVNHAKEVATKNIVEASSGFSEIRFDTFSTIGEIISMTFSNTGINAVHIVADKFWKLACNCA